VRVAIGGGVLLFGRGEERDGAGKRKEWGRGKGSGNGRGKGIERDGGIWREGKWIGKGG